jgi:error-prone DNA polymerase
MVHPYLRRRAGQERRVPLARPASRPDELKQILGRTLGVPIFRNRP